MDQYMIDELSFYFPSVAERAVGYSDDGRDILIIEMENGRTMLFDTMTKSIETLPEDPNAMTEEECKQEFGRRLRRAMRHAGYDQKGLSEKTGIAAAMLSRYMTGKSSPSFYNVDKIVKALGCSADDLRYY